jgi:charged multivesicular body protein 3
VEKAIREAAKRNDIGSAKVRLYPSIRSIRVLLIDPVAWSMDSKALAKEVVRSRRAVNRLYENKAQLNSISMHPAEIVGST